MSDQIPPQQVVVVAPGVSTTPSPPASAMHSVHVAQIADKLAGTLHMTGLADPGNHHTVAPTAETVPLSEKLAAAPTPPAGETAPAEEVAAEETVAPTPAPAPAPKPQREDASKLSRALDIQRRAEAINRRARADKVAAEAAVKEAAALQKAVAAQQAEADKAVQVYQSKLRLLESDPLEFAKQHGVDGAAVADFVKSGTDKNARAIDSLRRDFAAALDAVKNEAVKATEGLKQQLAQKEAFEIKRNFLSFVDEVQVKAPEQYEAMGLVYSQEELWNVANHLAEENDRLQLGLTPDTLLEKVESKAKSDPRWAKLQKRLSSNTPSTPKPNAPPTKKPQLAETRPVEEVREKPAAARDPLNGQFTSHNTPMARHSAHVARIASNTRF